MIDTLYETIGGRKIINAAVDLFYQKVLADDSVRQFFEGMDMNHLRARQSMFLTMLLGGRIVYTGKDIRAAHAHPREMGMGNTHFDTILKHFAASLEEVGVQAGTVQKIMTLLEGTRNAVLNF